MADTSFRPHLRHQFMSRNNLKVLFIVDSKEIEWQWFQHSQKLDCLGLSLLENSFLSFRAFRILESGRALSKRLTTTMKYLTRLHLYSLQSCDLGKISYAICLIRSSPSLQYLSISLVPDVKNRNPMELTVERYVETLCCTDMILDLLQVVRITGLVGSRAELHFIKLLHASSPCLGRNIMISKKS